MDRGIFLFDTSSLSSTAVISAATMSLYGSATSENSSGWATTINIYSSAPASDTVLAAGDYDSCGTSAYSDTSIAYASWTTAAYNNFAFNATGIAGISKTGITKTSSRSNWDATNTTPTWSNSISTTLLCHSAVSGGAADDPKLVVTYSTYTEDVPYVIAYVTRTDLFAGSSRT
jgi:hypothetical protein